jgi:hypothetical protein
MTEACRLSNGNPLAPANVAGDLSSPETGQMASISQKSPNRGCPVLLSRSLRKRAGLFTSATKKTRRARLEGGHLVSRRFCETREPRTPEITIQASPKTGNFRQLHQSKSLPNVVHTFPYIQNVPRGTFVQIAVMFHGEHFSILWPNATLKPT